jgi:chemotaxis protein methyltransferase CheR
MTFTPGTAEVAALPAPEPVARLLRDLIHERTGVFFETNRLDTMLEKIRHRLVVHRCQSYLDYYYVLKYDDRAPGEWREVMNAYSVQETYFWREHDQLTALVTQVIPQWFKETSMPLRIWSAACASGEEPYSIAIAVQEAGFGSHPIEILASDASENALEKARSATYRERSFRTLPIALRERYFTRDDDQWKLHTGRIPPVQFFWANLVALDENPLVPAHAQVIFCRNVFIYFSTASIKGVASQFAKRIPPGGHLFIGASESLNKLTNEFELSELGSAFVYRRK